jgi:hypothetical protein
MLMLCAASMNHSQDTEMPLNENHAGNDDILTKMKQQEIRNDLLARARRALFRDQGSITNSPTVETREQKKPTMTKTTTIVDEPISMLELTALHDCLCEVLSSSVLQENEEKAWNSMVLMSLGETLREEEEEEDIYTNLSRCLCTEIQLYSALWLTCLYLLSATGPTADDGPTSFSMIRETLKTHTRQCKLIVTDLKRIVLNFKNDREGCVINEWENEIQKVIKTKQLDLIDLYEDKNTKEGSRDHSDDDDEENLLAISKEQLEFEEGELLKMASTPIPSEL